LAARAEKEILPQWRQCMRGSSMGVVTEGSGLAIGLASLFVAVVAVVLIWETERWE
jgi:hypothetical protein